MRLGPDSSALPFRFRVAAAAEPEAVSGADPRSMFPAVNSTAPAGEAEVPFTVAVKIVEAVGAMVAGLAVSVVVVGTGAVTVIVTGAEVEALKAVLPL